MCHNNKCKLYCRNSGSGNHKNYDDGFDGGTIISYHSSARR